MVSIYDQYTRGEQATYNNKKVTVVSYSNNNRYVVIIDENGVRRIVDKNSLLFDFKPGEETENPIQNMIDERAQEMEELDEKIKESNKKWNTYVRAIKDCKKSIAALFSKTGVKSANQLRGKDKDEYKEFAENINIFTSGKHRESANVISYAHAGLDCALHKGELEQQLMLYT